MNVKQDKPESIGAQLLKPETLKVFLVTMITVLIAINVFTVSKVFDSQTQVITIIQSDFETRKEILEAKEKILELKFHLMRTELKADLLADLTLNDNVTSSSILILKKIN